MANEWQSPRSAPPRPEGLSTSGAKPQLAHWVAQAWFLTGATASGKSAVSLALARQLNAEILSLDSMAVFRRLDLGTAKPTPAERRQTAHHLIDLVEPEQEFSVAQYLAAAETAAAEIAARGRTLLFVGGTPLYLKALLRGLSEGPPPDWNLRRELADWARQAGPLALHERLRQVDAPSAARIHPRDTKRLIRALEVYAHTGQPLSQSQNQFQNPPQAVHPRVFVLDWPRNELRGRIDDRVDQMLAAGWLAEVEHLLAEGRHLGRTASQALGYRELIEFRAGQRTWAETREQIQARTRQLAKRQLTWFRSLPECQWIRAGRERTAIDLAREIVERGTASASGTAKSG